MSRSLDDIMDTRRNTARVEVTIPPALKRSLDRKSHLTGMPLTVALRRMAILWVNGKLDELLAEAPHLPLDPEADE